jgi:hypothetical protein
MKKNLWAKAKASGSGAAKNANAPKHTKARKAPAGESHGPKKK